MLCHTVSENAAVISVTCSQKEHSESSGSLEAQWGEKIKRGY